MSIDRCDVIRSGRPGLAQIDEHPGAARLHGQDLVPVLTQAFRGLVGQFLAAEQELGCGPRRDTAQLITRLDVVQGAAEGRQIDALRVFFSAAAATTAGMEALRSS